VKDAILTAISMPKSERTARMRSLRKRVLEHDVARWSRDFLDVLESRAHHGSKGHELT
jgi:trehalose 6-phosphate synthase